MAAHARAAHQGHRSLFRQPRALPDRFSRQTRNGRQKWRLSARVLCDAARVHVTRSDFTRPYAQSGGGHAHYRDRVHQSQVERGAIAQHVHVRQRNHGDGARRSRRAQKQAPVGAAQRSGAWGLLQALQQRVLLRCGDAHVFKHDEKC